MLGCGGPSLGLSPLPFLAARRRQRSPRFGWESSLWARDGGCLWCLPPRGSCRLWALACSWGCCWLLGGPESLKSTDVQPCGLAGLHLVGRGFSSRVPVGWEQGVLAASALPMGCAGSACHRGFDCDSRSLSGLLSTLPLTGRIQATGGGGGGGGSVLESHGNSQSLERGPARPGVGGTASMSMGSSHCCPARSRGPSLCTSAGRGLEGGGRRCVRKVRGGGVESGSSVWFTEAPGVVRPCPRQGLGLKQLPLGSGEASSSWQASLRPSALPFTSVPSQ